MNVNSFLEMQHNDMNTTAWQKVLLHDKSGIVSFTLF